MIPMDDHGMPEILPNTGRVNALAQLSGPGPMLGDRRQAFEQYLRGTGYTGEFGGPEMHAYLANLRQQGQHPRMDFRAQYAPASAAPGAPGAAAFDWQRPPTFGGLPGRPGAGGPPGAPAPRPMYPTAPTQGVAVGEPYGKPQNALATLGGARRMIPITRR